MGKAVEAIGKRRVKDGVLAADELERLGRIPLLIS